MLLQGGISKDNYLGGSGGNINANSGTGSTSGQMLASSGNPIASIIGAIKQDVDERKNYVRRGFGDFANGMAMNAYTASNFHPNFNPQNVQIQPAQMLPINNNLYNYLTR